MVIQMAMRPYLLKCIHQGHMGTEKSKAYARACVYWLVMYRDTEGEIKQCTDIFEHKSKKTVAALFITSTSL